MYATTYKDTYDTWSPNRSRQRNQKTSGHTLNEGGFRPSPTIRKQESTKPTQHRPRGTNWVLDSKEYKHHRESVKQASFKKENSVQSEVKGNSKTNVTPENPNETFGGFVKNNKQYSRSCSPAEKRTENRDSFKEKKVTQNFDKIDITNEDLERSLTKSDGFVNNTRSTQNLPTQDESEPMLTTYQVKLSRPNIGQGQIRPDDPEWGTGYIKSDANPQRKESIQQWKKAFDLDNPESLERSKHRDPVYYDIYNHKDPFRTSYGASMTEKPLQETQVKSSPPKKIPKGFTLNSDGFRRTQETPINNPIQLDPINAKKSMVSRRLENEGDVRSSMYQSNYRNPNILPQRKVSSSLTDTGYSRQ
eukprot:gb/GECH01014385.1/.p1 GENE.gb/GECH01014385.1/~~gb/GECH01014385.1/.p1  ORF type:complete len:361 (+),score=56.90 gb/GECH01014385.1/:1-1083(+)